MPSFLRLLSAFAPATAVPQQLVRFKMIQTTPYDQAVQTYINHAQKHDGIDITAHRKEAWYKWLVLYRVFEARAYEFNLLLAFPLGDWLQALIRGGEWRKRAFSALKTWALFLFDHQYDPIVYFEQDGDRLRWIHNADLPRAFAEKHSSIWGLIVPKPSSANPTWTPDPEKTMGSPDHLPNGSATMTTEQATSLVLLGRRLLKRDPIHDNTGKKPCPCLQQVSPLHSTKTISELMPWQELIVVAGHRKSIHGCSSRGQCNAFAYVQTTGQLLMERMESLGWGFSMNGLGERIRRHVENYKFTYPDLVRAYVTASPTSLDHVGAQQEIFKREIKRLEEAPCDQAELALLAAPSFRELGVDLMRFTSPGLRPCQVTHTFLNGP